MIKKDYHKDTIHFGIARDGKYREVWKPEIIEFVRDNISVHGAKWCAAKIGCNPNSIYMMRRKYGLPYSCRPARGNQNQPRRMSRSMDSLLHALRAPLAA